MINASGVGGIMPRVRGSCAIKWHPVCESTILLDISNIRAARNGVRDCLWSIKAFDLNDRNFSNYDNDCSDNDEKSDRSMAGMDVQCRPPFDVHWE